MFCLRARDIALIFHSQQFAGKMKVEHVEFTKRLLEGISEKNVSLIQKEDVIRKNEEEITKLLVYFREDFQKNTVCIETVAH